VRALLCSCVLQTPVLPYSTPRPGFRASLLAKHSAERAAAENERVAAEKAALRRQNELQNALAATQASLQEKEAILSAVWAATEALEAGAATVMRRELDVLRSMQIKDARTHSQRR